MILYFGTQIQNQRPSCHPPSHVLFPMSLLAARRKKKGVQRCNRLQRTNIEPQNHQGARKAIRAQSSSRSAVEIFSFFGIVLPRETRDLGSPVRHQILDRGMVFTVHPGQLLECLEHCLRSSEDRRLLELHTHRQKSVTFALLWTRPTAVVRGHFEKRREERKTYLCGPPSWPFRACRVTRLHRARYA